MNQEQYMLDIKALLETANETNAAKTQEIKNLDTSLTDLGQTTIELSKAVLRTSSDVDTQHNKVINVSLKQDAISEKVDDLRSLLSTITNVEGFSSSLDKDIKDELAKVLQNTEQSQENIKQSLIDVYEKYTNKVISLSSKLEEIKGLIQTGQYEQKINDVQNDTNRLSLKLDQMKEDQENKTKETVERIDKLVTSVDSLVQAIEVSNMNAESVERAVEDATTRIGVMETRVDALNA